MSAVLKPWALAQGAVHYTGAIRSRRMKYRIVVVEEKCTGCRACELACSFQQKKSFHHGFSLIQVLKNERSEGFFIPTLCHHCESAPCARECPVNAITCEDNSGEIVRINKEKCTGCGICAEVCPWAIPKIDVTDHIARICDICNGNPLCIEFCLPGALFLEVERGNQLESLVKI
jgi:carbon-monoxide dehydrogenase iron sulfur subunit